jgi:hypothetical protein
LTDIDTDIFVNCNWVDTRWQQCSTHLHTNNTEKNFIFFSSTNLYEFWLAQLFLFIVSSLAPYVSSSSLPSFSGHFSRHLPILILTLVSVLLLMVSIYIYTKCPRRKGPNFGRVFLKSNYTDITQNTYIQSSMLTEILAREKCGFLWCLRTVLCP